MLLAWFLPLLYHMVSDQSARNVFTYYSSVENAFCTMDYNDGGQGFFGRNLKTGKEYSESEFDSILPLFYAKQLFKDNRFPDSINGQAVTVQDISRGTFFLKYNPVEISTPAIPIYTLFESFSGRVKLEMPGDVFRIKNKIEFINPETNEINIKKSQLFMQAFEGVGFAFPAKKLFGNPTLRKLYDEGYFVLDAKDRIFHLKMVNGKPFVKNINIPADIQPLHITVREPQDKSHYGFLFDKKDRVYLITTNNYELQLIKTPVFNAEKDRLIVMANPFFWMTNVVSDKGKECLALEAISKNVVDSISLLRPQETEVVLSYVFPFQITFLSGYSEFVKPCIQFAELWVLVVNFVLAFIFWLYFRQKDAQNLMPYLLWIGGTGVFGFIVCLLLKE